MNFMADDIKNGNGDNGKKKKKIIAIVASAVALCLIAAIVLLLLLRPGDDEENPGPVVSGSQSGGNVEPDNGDGDAGELEGPVIPPIDEPERPEEPAIPETNVTAGDEATLRKYLLYDGDLTITLTDNVEVPYGMVSRGNKTLLGNKTVSYSAIGVPQGYIIELEQGATMTFDGPTLNGNYRSSGLLVNVDANLVFVSGSVTLTATTGIEVDGGSITVKDGSFNDLGGQGIHMRNAAKGYVEGGSFTKIEDRSIYIASTCYLSITGNPVFADCKGKNGEGYNGAGMGAALVAAEGDTEMEIHGGTYDGSNADGEILKYGIYSAGRLDVSPASADGYIEVNNVVDCVRGGAGSEITVDRVRGKNITGNALKSNANAKFRATNCRFENEDFDMAFGMSFTGDDNETYAENVYIKNVTSSGVIVWSNNSKFTGKNVQLVNCHNTGLYVNDNDNTKPSTVVAENFTIDGCRNGMQARGKSTLTISGSKISNCYGRGANIESGGIIYSTGNTFTGNVAEYDQNGGGAVMISSNGRFVDRGSVFDGNHSPYNGAGAIKINIDAVAELHDSAFTGNYTDGSGGAVRSSGGTLIGENLTFKNNYTTGTATTVANGGAIYVSDVDGGGVTLTSTDPEKSVFEGNYATHGGAVNMWNRNVSIQGYTFRGNYCFNAGGAVSVQGGNFEADGCRFEENYTDEKAGSGGRGGAVFAEQFNDSGDTIIETSLTFKDAVFIKNTANGTDKGAGGGAIYMKDAITVETYGVCEFTENGTTTGQAGAVFVAGGTFNDYAGSKFTGNYSGFGGALKTNIGSTTNLYGTEFTGNHADPTESGNSGNAGAVMNGGRMTGIDVYFRNNKTPASSVGGAIAGYDNENSVLTLTGNDKNKAVFEENFSNYGGCVRQFGGSITITGYTFKNNTVHQGGAVAALDGGTLALEHCTVENNGNEESGTGKGGAVYADTSRAKVELTDVTFEKNYAHGTDEYDTGGGALWIRGGARVTSTQCRFRYNTSDRQAGAIYLANDDGGYSDDSPTYSDTGSEFIGNSSAINAGAIKLNAGTGMKLNGTVFESNHTDSEHGGAIRSSGGVIIGENCVFKKNYTGADPAAMTGDGGAIYLSGAEGGRLSLTSSDKSKYGFYGNSAGYGGAVCTQGGTVDITGYTFSENPAGVGGGALYVENTVASAAGCDFTGNYCAETGKGLGGALYTIKRTVDTVTTFSACNFIGNHADAVRDEMNNGGGFANIRGGAAVVTKDGCVFKGNYSNGYGGVAALADGSSFTDTGSQIGGDKEGDGNRSKDHGGALYIDKDRAAGAGNTVTLTGTEFIGNSSDEKNGGAIFNGGGTVIGTNVKFSGNKTSDGGVGGAIQQDGGTVKLNTGDGVTVDAAKSVFENNYGNYGGSLSIYGGTVEVKGYTFDGNTALRGGGAASVFSSAQSLTLTGCSVENSRTGESGNGKGGALYVDAQDGTAVNINDTSFTGNKTLNTSMENGGGVLYMTKGVVKFTGNAGNKPVIKGNSSIGNGGAVHSAGGTLTIENYVFEDNRSETDAESKGRGGAIYLTGAVKPTVKGTDFKLNKAVDGGAVYISGGVTVTFTGDAANKPVFSGNTATKAAEPKGDGAGYGGAIYGLDKCSVTVENYRFESNSATGHGGAVYNDGAAYKDTGSVYGGDTEDLGNVSGSYGGAIYVKGAETQTVTVNKSEFKHNRAQFGGAVFADANAEITFTGDAANKPVFSGNTATQAGAIYGWNNCTVTVENYRFEGNEATNDRGGAVYISKGATYNDTGSLYGGDTDDLGNKSGEWGGAICVTGAKANFTKSEFKHNRAKFGGAVFADRDGAVTVTGDAANKPVFSGNTASNGGKGDGGAIFAFRDNSAVTVTNYRFESNRADRNGGAVYVESGATYTDTGSLYGGDTDELGNEAGYYGGAICVNGCNTNESSTKGAAANVTKSDFKHNKAVFGGAVMVYSSKADKAGTITLTGDKAAMPVFEGNSAKTEAGAVDIYNNGVAVIKDYKFSRNTAPKNPTGRRYDGAGACTLPGEGENGWSTQ